MLDRFSLPAPVHGHYHRTVNRAERERNVTTSLGTHIAIVLLSLSLAGDISASSTNTYDYSPDRCDYVISFPSVPRLSKLYAENLGTFTSANLDYDDGVFLRAECIPIDVNAGITADSLLEVMKSYVALNGLQYASYESGADESGQYIDLRAYKSVAGEAGTFRVRSYVGTQSYLSAYAGSPSEIYPTAAILLFFKSIRLK